ncbi:MAG: quinone-dependent dihydroorotate dehydrogenase [Bacteroidales bacterium]|nr:quinone-dependent dihydroorotate dehydrogenase [Bacteroidales bacterium]
MYKHLIRPLLFLLKPEAAHNLTFRLLRIGRCIPFFRAICRKIFCGTYPSLERELFGLRFPNPVGLAGGLDKNGEFYNDLANFGFGFVEIGSLTPLPQDGNPKPRLFRLPADKAIINRMGINNKGVAHAIENLRKNKPGIIVAANISKNHNSLNDECSRDYETAFSYLYDYVDMFVVNISCPNVEGLTDLQDISFLSEIIDRLIDNRAYHDESKPILVKLSPDLCLEQIDEILNYLVLAGVDGVVVSNTTRSRDNLPNTRETALSIGKGGLSGAPLYSKSLPLVKHVHEKTAGSLPIIASGGIMTPEQAKEMLDAGASLVEIYSAFIYEGPGIIKKINSYLSAE